jgi:hypothetical protein
LYMINRLDESRGRPKLGRHWIWKASVICNISLYFAALFF